MDTDVPSPESVEVEGNTSIAIVYERRWPRYVASWSARVQTGDTDYPLAADSVQAMPAKDADPAVVWEDLRQRAMNSANASIAARVSATPERKPGLLSRLFGRGSR